MTTTQADWVDGYGRMDDHPLGEALVRQISEVCGGPAHTQRARELLPLLVLQRGQAVIEVGCGTGAIVREIARLTAGSVRIVGVDPSTLVLAQAARELAASDLGPLAEAITFRHMDGRALAFPNGSFAAAVSSRVLIHAPEPERIVAEMARTVQPQGRVLCIEPVAQFAAGVDDTLRQKVSAWTNPLVGRALAGIMRRAGLRDVRVIPHTAINLDPPDVRTWREEFAAGAGSRAASVRDGRCTPDDVEALFRQYEASIHRGDWMECAVHFAVLGRKAL
jgi:ubiquinone/menaquinone biosynthesis C-methylase UbiE